VLTSGQVREHGEAVVAVARFAQDLLLYDDDGIRS
jgi:hypothetical protein